MGRTVLKVAASKEEEEGDEKDARDPGAFAQSDHSQSQAPPTRDETSSHFQHAARDPAIRHFLVLLLTPFLLPHSASLSHTR